jgi:hypothetical protein
MWVPAQMLFGAEREDSTRNAELAQAVDMLLGRFFAASREKLPEVARRRS